MTLQNTFQTGLALGTALTPSNSDDGSAGDAFDYVDEDITQETSSAVRIHCPATIDAIERRKLGWDVEDGGSDVIDVSIRFQVLTETLPDEAPAATIYEDLFTRADSSTTLGSGWTAHTGTWGVSGNKAYLETPGNGGGAATPNGVLNELPTELGKIRATYWASTGAAREGGRTHCGVVADGFLYIFGAFNRVEQIGGGEFTRINACRFDLSTGELDETWELDCTPDGLGGGYVNACVLTATHIIIGGDFDTVDGFTRAGLAAINRSTGAVSGHFQSFACNGDVNALVLDGTDLYVGGEFTSIGGSTRNRAAKLDVTTTTVTVDATWNPNCGAAVASMCLCDNGTKRISLNLDPVSGSVGGSGDHSLAMVNATNGAKVWGIKPNAGGGYTTAANPDWGANGIIVFGGVGSGGNTVYARDFNDGSALWFAQGNGDIQGMFFHRDLLYVSHHDNRFMAQPNVVFDGTSALAQQSYGSAVLDETGTLQPAPWRSRFEQDGTYTFGSGVLKTWGGLGYEDADRAFIVYWGDFTRVRNFANTQSATPQARRIALFDEGLTPGAAGASSNVVTRDPGVSDYRVSADVDLSATTERVNSGVVARLTGPNDYLFGKIEITSGSNFAALMKNTAGAGSTILATGSKTDYDEGSVYTVQVEVEGNLASLFVYEGSTLVDTVSYTLTSGEMSTFTGRGAGLRIRYASDEDDGTTVFDNFRISEVGAGDLPSNTGPAPAVPLVTAYDELWRVCWSVVRDSGGQILLLDRRGRIIGTTNLTVPRDFTSRIDVHAEIDDTAVSGNAISLKLYPAPSAPSPAEVITLSGSPIGSPGRVFAHVLFGPTQPAAKAVDVLLDQVSAGAATTTTITAEKILAGGSAANADNYVTSSADVDGGKLLVMDVGVTQLGAEPSTPSLSSAFADPGDWTLVASHYWRSPSGTNNRFKLFRFATITDSVPSDGAITIAFGSVQQGCEWSLTQVDGVTGSSVAEAFGQHSFTTPNVSGLTGQITAPALANPANALLTVFEHLANEGATAGTGHTELSDSDETGHTGPSIAMMTQFMLGEDTNIDATWATSAFYGGIASELLAVADVVVPSGLVEWESMAPDSGGGYQDFSQCPVHPTVFTYCSDVGGARIRRGFGAKMEQFNRGLFDSETYRKTESVLSVEDPANPGHCKTLMAFGQQGNAGTAVSYDHGDWEHVGENNVNFNMHNGGPAIVEKVRTVGKQIAFDSTHDTWYLLSFGDGIYRTANDGQTATLIAGGNGLYGRYMKFHEGSQQLFVGIYQSSIAGGLYKIATPWTGTGKVMTRYTHADNIRNCESFDFYDTTVVCAIAPTGAADTTPGRGGSLQGDAGVYRASTGGASLTKLTGTGIDNQTWPLSVGISDEGSSIVCVVGLDNAPILSGSRYRSLIRTTDLEAGTPTWVGIGLASDITDGSHPGNSTFGNQRLGRQNSTPCMIIPTPGAGGINTRRWTLLVAEGGICYSSTDGGRHWFQDNLGQTIWSNMWVKFDPFRPGWVYGGNQDNDVWYSPGDYATTIITRAQIANAVGSSITTSHDGSVAPNGQVWALDSNAAAGGVGNLGRGTPSGSTLSLAHVYNGGQLIACETGYLANLSTIRKIIFENGLGPRYNDDAAGAGSWTNTTGGPGAGNWPQLADALVNTPNLPMEWPDRMTGGADVYFIFRGSASASAGIWASNDRMATVHRLFQDTSMTGPREGHLACQSAAVIWYTDGNNLYRINGANTGTPTRTLIAGVSNASAICFDPEGNLYVYCTPDPGIPAKCLFAENPPTTGTPTFIDLGDPIGGEAANDQCQQLLQVNDMASDGDRILLSINGGSLVRGIRT